MFIIMQYIEESYFADPESMQEGLSHTYTVNEDLHAEGSSKSPSWGRKQTPKNWVATTSTTHGMDVRPRTH